MRKRFTRWDHNAVHAIDVVPITEFELSEKELGSLRRHLYAINKDGIRRYRTLRDGNIVLVWRIK